MKICGLLHMWPGDAKQGIVGHNAGSETTVASWMRALVRRGHEVSIICDRVPTAYDLDGVKIVKPPRRGQQSWINDYGKDADILITHLDCTKSAMQWQLDTARPLCHFVHNSMQFDFHTVTPNKCQLAVFNSHWVAEAQGWPGDQIVLHPTVEPEYYRCERGEKVTLVNPTPGKGAHQFYEIAKRLPDVQFLVVKSVYGEQIMPPHGVNNVEVMEHTPDIREALRKTKILLMPSEYESYGRIAVEAACCGIPTIANPTPGLLESLGEAGIFIAREDVDGQVNEINHLLGEWQYYSQRVKKAFDLANSLDPQSEFDRLETAFLETVEKWDAREKDGMERMWTSDRRLYKRADGSITESMREAQSLFCAEGGRIPESIAIELGYTQPPAVRVIPDLDTKALLAAPENKMESPDENKGKRKRAA